MRFAPSLLACLAAFAIPARAAPPDAAILIEGQSNAFLLWRDGAGRLRRGVEALLGFDGIAHRIAVLGGAGHSTWSATSLVPRDGQPAAGTWLAGDARKGWRPGALEGALDTYLRGVAPSLGAAAPLVIVWAHNESDSLNLALTPETWAGAVRFAIDDARRALGRTAPAEILWVPFDNYGALRVSHLDRFAQRLRIGFQALAATSGADVHLAASIGDSDMDGPPETPGPYGGMHFGAGDIAQAADRLALAIANRLAALARPGSAEARAPGRLPEAGRTVTSVRRAAPDALMVRTPVLRALSPAASAGAGWSAVLGKTLVPAVRVTPMPGGLLIRFAGPLPTGGRLYYGYGGGRIFPGGPPAYAPDPHLAPGRGAAILDANGLPLTMQAEGLAY